MLSVAEVRFVSRPSAGFANAVVAVLHRNYVITVRNPLIFLAPRSVVDVRVGDRNFVGRYLGRSRENGVAETVPTRNVVKYHVNVGNRP